MTDVRIMKPYIAFAEVEDDLRQVFESGVFTRGHNVETFAAEVSAYTGAAYTSLMTSATTALWTCLKLLEIKAGDEVAVADFSWPATANVVEDLGAQPIFIDVNQETFNMCPKDLANKITNKTKAVLFVDALGNPTGLHEIKSICDQYKLPLIEDAACAIGSSENGVKCGSIADLTCFSFHPRKLLCTGEGGAITTNRSDWAEWLRMKLMHGASGTRGVGLDFISYGYNFRMSEIQAVLGRKQLASLDLITDERNKIRESYIVGLESLGFIPQKIGKTATHNIQSMVFRVPNTVNRDKLIFDLKANGIETTLGTYCQSGTSYYQKKYNNKQPISANLEKTTITLPCFEDVPVDYIIEKITHLISV